MADLFRQISDVAGPQSLALVDARALLSPPIVASGSIAGTGTITSKGEPFYGTAAGSAEARLPGATAYPTSTLTASATGGASGGDVGGLVADFLGRIEAIRAEVQAILAAPVFGSADRDRLRFWSEQISGDRGSFWASASRMTGVVEPWMLSGSDPAQAAVADAWVYSGQVRAWLDSLWAAADPRLSDRPSDLISDDSMVGQARAAALAAGGVVSGAAAAAAETARGPETGLMLALLALAAGYMMRR